MPNPLGLQDIRSSWADRELRSVGETVFTANAAGTTTTLVGADASIGTGTNVLRIGEKFKLHTSGDVEKENKVFRVTGLSSSTGTTTVTFTPAAAAATASGDKAKLVSLEDFKDIESLNRRLTAIDSSRYTAARLEQMTTNDKIYALRELRDPKAFD